MFSFLLKSCTNCNNLEDAICAIDAVLAGYGKSAWQNSAFMTSKSVSYIRIKQLVYYKEILTHLKWNQDFYCPYRFNDIVSRVKALAGGAFKVAKRMKIDYDPITTTTTTTSTTSSTTTTTTTN